MKSLSELLPSNRAALQRILVSMAGTYKPETVYKEYKMSNGNTHKEMPGSGVAYWEAEKKSEKGPDYKGFVILEMDYKAGEKLKLAFWQRETARGSTLLAIKEDNWLKRINEEKNSPQEVTYAPRAPAKRAPVIDDSDLPF